jgi:hypothetical protein
MSQRKQSSGLNARRETSLHSPLAFQPSNARVRSYLLKRLGWTDDGAVRNEQRWTAPRQPDLADADTLKFEGFTQ